MKVKLLHKKIEKNGKKTPKVRIFTKTPTSRLVPSCKSGISFYENQLNALTEFVNEELENNRCPVTLEDFNSLDNPPYLIQGCNHRISLPALNKLKVFPIKVGQVVKTTYMHCPLCKNKMLFATLDFSYLKFSRLQQILSNPQSRDNDSLQKLVDQHPHYFTPRKGCLSLYNIML